MNPILRNHAWIKHLIPLAIFFILSTKGNTALSQSLTADAVEKQVELQQEIFLSQHSKLNDAPSDTITYNGPKTFCQGGQITLGTANAPSGSSFQWFLNGAPISGQTGATLFVTTSGSYSVNVTTSGVTITYPAVIVTVNPKPIVSFVFDNNNTCSGTPINFVSTVTSGTAPFTYAWTFGDGGTSSSANPTVGLTSLGCGNVTMNNSVLVTDSKGCTATVTNPISIIQAPNVQLADDDVFSPFSNCDNNPTITNPNFTITVNNISPSAGCINGYT
ncbi:MAG: PKD domain-containing protein, partial [Ferruginibacter sp.]